jgi:hypothetical protein
LALAAESIGDISTDPPFLGPLALRHLASRAALAGRRMPLDVAKGFILPRMIAEVRMF